MLEPMHQEPVLVDRVREAIVQAVVSGELRPGERLAQEHIAQRLGVSRQPVSHALSLLKDQGVLVELGRKGLTVAPIDPDRVLALYQVRGALDALAAREAARRVAGGSADADLLARLRSLLDARGTHGQDGAGLGQLVEADVTFHVTLYALSGNPVLDDVTRPHWTHLRRCMYAVIEDAVHRADIWPEHRAIAAAVLAGDEARAADLAEQHALRAGQSTSARLRADSALSDPG